MRQERNRSHPCSGWGCSERNAGLADDSCEVSSGHHPQTPALMLRLGVEKAGLKLDIQKAKIMASGPITSQQIDGEIMEKVTDFILGAPKSLQMVTAAMKLKDFCSLEEKL